MSSDTVNKMFRLSEGQYAELERIIADAFNKWESNLAAWTEVYGREKLKLLSADRIHKQDLLSLVLGLFDKDPGLRASAMDGLLANVRREEYSVSDLFVELCCLEDTLVDSLNEASNLKPISTPAFINWIRTRLRMVFLDVLNETSIVYERIAETGPAYCQTDVNGTIKYANKEMCNLLGVDSVVGRSLSDFLGGESRIRAHEAITGAEYGEALAFQSEVVSKSRGPIPVHIRIDPIFQSEGDRKGVYAIMTDMSASQELQKMIFDKQPLGILRVDAQLKPKYANKALLEMVGADSVEEIDIPKLVPDQEYMERVHRHFETRKEGSSDEYVIKIRRLDETDESRRMWVSVAACPELDDRGTLTGAFSVIRDLTLEYARTEFHRHIEACRDWRELLRKIAEETAKIVPYDLLLVTVYTKDHEYVRVIFNFPDVDWFAWPKRWFHVPPEFAAMIDLMGTQPIDDLKKMLEDPRSEKIKDEEVVRMFIDQGIQSFIRIPLLRHDSIVASMTFVSRNTGVFASFVESLKNLPLEDALNTAMHYRAIAEQQFRFELMKKISRSSDVNEVTQVIVDSLVEQHNWQDVEVFSVDPVSESFRLRAEAHSKNGVALDLSLVPEFSKGVLGDVYKTGKAKYLANVSDTLHFIRTNPKTKSELCIPIELFGSIRWLLNIEDSVENAFSEEDRVALEDNVKEASYILEHLYAHFYLRSLFDRSSEALFITDKGGKIVRCNEAMVDLLGYANRDQLTGRKIRDIVTQEDSDLDFIMKEINGYYHLVTAEGKQVDVFLSGSELDEDFDRKVFCAKDLSQIQRLQELEAVEEMYHEIAMQTRTSFSLLFEWLRRLRDGAVDTKSREVLEKALRQLRKIELTHERLVLIDVRKAEKRPDYVLLDLSTLVHMALDELPHSDSNRVSYDIPESLPRLKGNLFQLTFVLQTIISYLLRFAPMDEPVRLSAWTEEGRIHIVIVGFAPAAKTRKAKIDHEVLLKARAAMDVALGETIIRRYIVENHEGTYDLVPVGQDKVEFRITLPGSAEE